MKIAEILNFHRIFRSVFTKLTLIGLATWILLVIAVLFTFIVSRQYKNTPFYKHSVFYLSYLVKDLGSPPDRDKALVLSRKTGLHFSFVGPASRWTTGDAFPDVESIRFHQALDDDVSLLRGRGFNRHIFKLSTAGGVLYFEPADTTDEERNHGIAHLLLLAFLTAILLGSYFAVKRVLRPLKWLRSGLRQVKQGNLNHAVPLKGDDELTELSRNFNDMTSSLAMMLATRERLLRDISHELRSPLTRIRVALEFCHCSGSKEDIVSDLNDMEEMINSILETARHQHGDTPLTLETYDLAELISEVTVKYRNTPPGIRFHRPDSPVPLRIDIKAMKTVIGNCLDNGIKFSTATSAPLDIAIRPARHAHHSVAIDIVDHGCGIAEEELPFIFEPFYRVDSSRARTSGGFGLGLCISKAIVEAHGGTMVAHSRKDQGARITITLPLERA